MTKKHILAGLSILVLSSILLAACTAQAPTAQPTVDANAIYTQAAQTVEAGLAQTEAARPSPTVTATVTPTATTDPAVAAGMTATANAVLNPALQATATATIATTPLIVPTATKSVLNPPPASTSADKCEWAANSPADNSKLKRNASYDATIAVKNTGTTTWDKTYALRFFGGERMGIPADYFVQGEVKPGELYKFVFTIVMPDSLGKKEALMVVQNGQGSTMCWINLPFEVVE